MFYGKSARANKIQILRVREIDSFLLLPIRPSYLTMPSALGGPRELLEGEAGPEDAPLLFEQEEVDGRRRWCWWCADLIKENRNNNNKVFSLGN